MSEFRLTPEVFTILSGLVEDRLGLHYDFRDRTLFADKVAVRAVEAGFDSGLDYYYFLRYDPRGEAELDALADALVVNETYFFREADALRAAVAHVIRPAVEANGKARVLSAACSTGEEPLTIAMLLEKEGLLDAVEIVAGDVSARALERARSGTYRARSLRAMPADARARWFDDRGDVLHVRDDLHLRIDWRSLNLVAPGTLATLGTFDLVLCRNALIYFADATVIAVVENLAKHLRIPNGRLLIGASESLLRFGTLLECVERGGAFFYGRKP